MTLECIVNGYPDPDLLWYTGIYDPITNNKPLFDNNRYELEKAQSYGSAGTNVSFRVINSNEYFLIYCSCLPNVCFIEIKT